MIDASTIDVPETGSMMLTATDRPIAVWLVEDGGAGSPGLGGIRDSATAPMPASISLESFALTDTSPPLARIDIWLICASADVLTRLIAIVKKTALPPIPADSATAMMSESLSASTVRPPPTMRLGRTAAPPAWAFVEAVVVVTCVASVIAEIVSASASALPSPSEIASPTLSPAVEDTVKEETPAAWAPVSVCAVDSIDALVRFVILFSASAAPAPTLPPRASAPPIAMIEASSSAVTVAAPVAVPPASRRSASVVLSTMSTDTEPAIAKPRGVLSLAAPTVPVIISPARCASTTSAPTTSFVPMISARATVVIVLIEKPPAIAPVVPLRDAEPCASSNAAAPVIAMMSASSRPRTVSVPVASIVPSALT